MARPPGKKQRKRALYKPRACVLKICDLLRQGLDLETAASHEMLDMARVKSWFVEPRVEKLIKKALAERELQLLRLVEQGGLGMSQARAALEILKATNQRYFMKSQIVAEKEVGEIFSKLEDKLSPEDYAKVIAALEAKK